MKLITKVVLFFGLTSFAFAHDGGHGPKISNNGKYGGKLAAVILAADEENGAKAKLQFKAEAVVEEGQIRVYLYDKKMKRIKLSSFKANAKARVLKTFSDDKYSLTKGKRAFKGKLPQGTERPFSTDVYFEKDGIKYMASFTDVD